MTLFQNVFHVFFFCRVTNPLQNRHFWKVSGAQSDRLYGHTWNSNTLLFVCLRPGSSLTDSSVNSISEADAFSLSFTSNVCFSIWVSFCEIYNDNIHDLLEQVTYTAVLAKRSMVSILYHLWQYEMNSSPTDWCIQVPSGQNKRTVLRLSQDVKGNSFIKGKAGTLICVRNMSYCWSNVCERPSVMYDYFLEQKVETILLFHQLMKI